MMNANMAAYAAILYVLFFHWIGDFVCQSRWMADNKSKNINALTSHVLTYMVVMFVAFEFLAITSSMAVFSYVFINGVLHWITDCVTSKFTHHFAEKKEWHKFFTIVGFDQFIHQFCLISTIHYLQC